MTINDDKEHRNALTHLEPNAEGEDDVIYGPYLIKSSGQDAFLRLDLTAPLDSQIVLDALTIDAQRERRDCWRNRPRQSRFRHPLCNVLWRLSDSLRTSVQAQTNTNTTARLHPFRPQNNCERWAYYPSPHIAAAPKVKRLHRRNRVVKLWRW